MPRHILALALCVTCTPLLESCGYVLVRGNNLFGANTIAVIPFAEEEPVGLTTDLSHALTRLLSQHGMHVTHNQEHAQAILTGAIVSSSTRTSPVSIGARVPAYNIRITIHAWLASPKGTKSWETRLTLEEGFLAAGSDTLPDARTLRTESNRTRALLRVSERAARMIHEQLMLASAFASSKES